MYIKRPGGLLNVLRRLSLLLVSRRSSFLWNLFYFLDSGWSNVDLFHYVKTTHLIHLLFQRFGVGLFVNLKKHQNHCSMKVRKFFKTNMILYSKLSKMKNSVSLNLMFFPFILPPPWLLAYLLTLQITIWNKICQ